MWLSGGWDGIRDVSEQSWHLSWSWKRRRMQRKGSGIPGFRKTRAKAKKVWVTWFGGSTVWVTQREDEAGGTYGNKECVCLHRTLSCECWRAAESCSSGEWHALEKREPEVRETNEGACAIYRGDLREMEMKSSSSFKETPPQTLFDPVSPLSSYFLSFFPSQLHFWNQVWNFISFSSSCPHPILKPLQTSCYPHHVHQWCHIAQPVHRTPVPHATWRWHSSPIPRSSLYSCSPGPISVPWTC